MKRGLLRAASLLSLLLLTAALVLWPRSYWYRTGFSAHASPSPHRPDVLEVQVNCGRVTVVTNRHPREGRREPGLSFHDTPMTADAATPWRWGYGRWPGGGTLLGFRYSAGGVARGAPEARMLAVPFWFITLLLATGAAPGVTWAARGWRRRSRRLAGRCPSCGYDIRATPDRCPECGNAASVSRGE